ncbi:hypothetical protein ACFSSC_00065 [Corynebacterium mendelii]|uniref:Uncharacterized protein n=1 Tax=Corynebacterium mendelii TaxID=2765362 RepID=A0A939ITC0_9CORY|nr:hypothetical protein [Corynebacterium mendelii]MBN9643684.1 hypothetical protein [Corynebacterium mendelii]
MATMNETPTQTTSGEPAACSYPVISVVDFSAKGDKPVVVWHVHTGPAAITGRFNGGWVIGDNRGLFELPADVPDDAGDFDDDDESGTSALGGEVDSEDAEKAIAAMEDTRSDADKLESLLRGTHVIVAGRKKKAPAWMDTAASISDLSTVLAAANEGVAAINAAITEEAQRRRQARAKEKEETGKMTTSELAVFAIEPIAAPTPATFADAFHGDPCAEQAWCTAMAVGALVDAWVEVESDRRRRKYLKERFGAHPRPIPLG